MGRVQTRVTILNGASVDLEDASLRLGGVVAWVGGVPAGEEVVIDYGIEEDSTFVLQGTLADGRSIHSDELGYTTPYDGQNHRLVVSVDGSVRYQLGSVGPSAPGSR